jgi:hypothetical protein
MLCAWIMQRQLESISFSLAPWELAGCRTFNRICEQMSVKPASQFLIRNWAGLTDALLALKARLHRLPAGKAVIGIDDYGSITLQVDGPDGSCRLSDDAPDLQIDRLTATRLLFGPMPPSSVIEIPDTSEHLLNSWLPLPLAWIGQDRV